MADVTKSFGETTNSLARNPLGIIALFIVLVYGFASMVTAFASERVNDFETLAFELQAWCFCVSAGGLIQTAVGTLGGFGG
jgi:sugar phosphate permease